MSSALEGIRVLDFTRVLSGPYATMTLADLGADVVKVERAEGDDTRAFGPPWADGVSTYFLSINRGKRSLVADLKDPDDLELIKRLACRADVLIENFRPGVMARLGLDYEHLRERAPGLVYCSITGFGRSRPGPSYDLVIQGLSGVPSITGEGERPYKCGASIADLVSGMNAVQGILAALLRRERTGRGGLVDVSMLDGELSLLVYHAGSWLNAGVEPQALGNRHPSIHPFSDYATADGHITLAIGNDGLFVRLCRALEVEWDEDPRFGSNGDRVKHREALDALLSPILQRQGSAHWLCLFEEQGIPSGPMCSVPEALERAQPVEHAHPAGGAPVRSLPPGFRLDGSAWASDTPPPALGAHRVEVLGDWLETD